MLFYSLLFLLAFPLTVFLLVTMSCVKSVRVAGCVKGPERPKKVTDMSCAMDDHHECEIPNSERLPLKMRGPPEKQRRHHVQCALSRAVPFQMRLATEYQFS
jgi:hypothetical protein